MRSFARHAPRFSLTCVVLAFFAAAALEGCGGRPSEQQAVDEFFKNNSKSKQEAVARFAGRVTVDGLPPSRQLSRLFVILSDPQKLEKPKDGSIRFASCDEQGNFEFTTYVKGDGVPYGKYVVTFVQLHKPTRAGHAEWGSFRNSLARTISRISTTIRKRIETKKISQSKSSHPAEPIMSSPCRLPVKTRSRRRASMP